MPLSTQVGLGPGHIVLDGVPAPPPPKGHSSQFSALVCCGQTAGWIKMPLGIEVRFGPGDIVLDGDSAPLKRGTTPPLFGPCLLWPDGRPSQLLLSTCLHTHKSTSGMNHIAFTPQLQSVTAFWPVLIFRPALSRKLSCWPERLVNVHKPRWFTRPQTVTNQVLTAGPAE